MPNVKTTRGLFGALAALLLATCFAIGAAVVPPHREASAAQPYAVDRVSTFKGSIASAAAVNTAVTGAKIRVKKIAHISTSSASNITFTDGSGGSTVLNLYLAAHTPQNGIDLGGGILLSSATALYAVADTGTGTLDVVLEYNIE